jgi:hypothetical protein
VAAGEDGDRAGLETRAMRGEIDTAGEPRHDNEAGAAESARQPVSEGKPRRRSIARADDRDTRTREGVCLPAHRDQRRRCINRPQSGGIIRLAERDELHAHRGRGGHFVFRFRPRRDLDWAAGCASFDEVRQCLERRAGAAEAV